MKIRIRFIISFIILLLAEIAIGKWGRGFVRGFVGDVLVIPTIYMLLRATFFGKDSIFSVYVLPFLCYYLGWWAEILQAIGILDILGINRDSILAIMLGGHFDWLDILAYLLGLYAIGIFLAFESRGKEDRRWWYPIGVFLHWTWGNMQTVAGLVLYLIYINSPHTYYRGVVKTAWPHNSGISLGFFIFTPCEETAGNKEERMKYCNEVTVHEYGHTFQALLLGPLYVFVIGIPSLLWGRIPFFINLRKKKNILYTWLYCEKWASDWGEAVTKEKAIRD